MSEATALQTVQMIPMTTTVNGTAWSGEVPAEEVLLDFLRARVGLTGTKRGCESEVCGACEVLVDGAPVSSCNYFAFEANGRSITTVEGIAEGDKLHPIQEAFIRNAAAQCGYCTPGQIVSAVALLRENSSPTYESIAHWLVGNICRCGCYPAIAHSIMEAAAELRGDPLPTRDHAGSPAS
jgi:aerobic-type carbon monoxide dehydrogenase small subunit (CoxS/CutS family)